MEKIGVFFCHEDSSVKLEILNAFNKRSCSFVDFPAAVLVVC